MGSSLHVPLLNRRQIFLLPPTFADTRYILRGKLLSFTLPFQEPFVQHYLENVSHVSFAFLLLGFLDSSFFPFGNTFNELSRANWDAGK